jgi:diketogulonate reductase-like aldo/keto reductase
MASNTFSLTTRVPLNNGRTIPAIHLGVYLMSGKEASRSVKYALDAGYRAIDSAQMYHNEREVGNAILDWLKEHPDVKRENIHYTTKLASNSDYARARKSITKSVQECGLGYVDLFLLHSPYGGRQARLDSWKALEDAIESGEVKSGGVSNYGEKHVSTSCCLIGIWLISLALYQIDELLLSNPRIRPTVNQIEVHPFNTRSALTQYCKDNDIMVEAYAPLARALRMKHPVIVQLSKEYGCTPAQLMVRWSLQHGYVPLPKSVKKERVEENAQIGHFEISEEHMGKMDALDEYLVTGEFVWMILQWQSLLTTTL